MGDAEGRCPDIIETVERVCRERNLRLTPARRQVLELLAEEGKALGAYELLRKIGGDKAAAYPPAAYRALEFLQRNGFVHRVREAKRFVACSRPGEPHDPVLLVCGSCGEVEELPAADTSAIASGISAECGGGQASGVGAGESGCFLETAHAIEIVGRCALCSADRVRTEQARE